MIAFAHFARFVRFARFARFHRFTHIKIYILTIFQNVAVARFVHTKLEFLSISARFARFAQFSITSPREMQNPRC